MSQFYHILNTHLDLLREKGYQEKDSGSPNIEGLLFKEFHSKLSNAVNEALRFDCTTNFTIDAIGYFEKQLANPVNIKLSYRFDPEIGDLTIDQFELEYDEKVTATAIKSNKDLPHCHEIPTILKRLFLKKNRILISRPKQNYKKRKL